MKLQTQWNQRNELHAEGCKLYAKSRKLLAEGCKLYAEGDNLYAQGDRLRTEGCKLYAEGDKLWAESVLETYGKIQMEYKYPNWCTLHTPDGEEVYTS